MPLEAGVVALESESWPGTAGSICLEFTKEKPKTVDGPEIIYLSKGKFRL